MEGQIVALNHAGIRDFESASDFYENRRGFPLACHFNDDDGSLMFAFFLQFMATVVSRAKADVRIVWHHWAIVSPIPQS
jgi:hypothetical protein